MEDGYKIRREEVKMFKKLFAVCLLVEDARKSFEFYSKTLGLEVNSQDGSFADFKLGETSLAIFQKDEATTMIPRGYFNTGGGVILGFQVDDVQKACEQLTEKGVVIIEGPKTTSWGQTVAYFTDPDGNIWEISQK
jgi:catechol 2,3-dioxygenase-like lactoylglutathione lyase family enzyme